MLWLAVKTLLHEKGRLVITLVGIIFSTVLTLTQVGMYIGMMGNATSVIRHTDADIWIASKNIQNFDFANPFPEQRINRVRSMPDVVRADNLILTWGFLKLADGGQDQVQIIGFNPDSGAGAPWNMVQGNAYDVKGGRYIIMDTTSEARLGRLVPGTVWELNKKRVKLTGLSNGIKSFTTAPVTFMAYEQAQVFLDSWAPDSTSYIVAKVRDISRVDDVARELSASMNDNDVYTKKGFLLKTMLYWTVQTGIGMAFFLTAVLGLIVGGAIVGQTVYANTMEHLREFGTLKALGARNSWIYQVILGQVGISTVAGFTVGSIIILAVKDGFEKAGVNLYLEPVVFLSLFFVVLFTCFSSAYFSVRKIRTLDPVTVFRS